MQWWGGPRLRLFSGSLELWVAAEADLIAATARKGRGLKDRAKGAHLDDIAAGVLLDRYFAGTHGAAEEITPMGGDDVSR